MTRMSGAVCSVLVAMWFSTCAAQSLVSESAVATQDKPNAVFFRARRGGSEIPQADIDRSRQDLAAYKDPAERKKLRAEARPQIVERHPDLGEMLELDAAAERRLVDLLVEQELDQRQEALESLLARADGKERKLSGTYRQAGKVTRQRSAIRELLGEASFGRYLDYAYSLRHRMQVAPFSRRLERDVLSRQQRERMIELFAQQERGIDLAFDEPGPGMQEYFDAINRGASEEELARYSLLRNVKSNEESFVRARELNAQRVQAAAQILTPSQHAVFTAFEAQRLESHRGYVRDLRKSAGLDPDAPIVAAAPSTADVATPSRVRWSASITVDNGTPKVVTFVSDVGQPVSFDVESGLSIEAVPIARGARLRLEMKVRETLSDGPHNIGDLHGTVRLQPAADPNWNTHQYRTLIIGSKAYPIAYSITAAPQ